MGMREWPLPRLYEVLHGEERGRWPTEARFLEAAHNGDVREIKKIAKELDVQGHGIRMTVANTTYMGMNALHAAGGGGRLPIYRYLVEEVKMDVDMPDTAQKFTPVSHAILYGHLPAVRYLVDHGADLHQRRGKITLLHMAVVHEPDADADPETDAVPVIGSPSDDLAFATEQPEFTPVSHAILYGHLPAVRYLVDHGADLHQRRGKITLLHMAVVHGYYEIVKFLLARGANVHAMSELGTPLTDATLRGFPSIVKILLEHKSDPNVVTRILGPLNMAVDKSSVSCVKLLIQGGANVSSVFPCYDPLLMAAEKGLTEAIKCLLEAGANPNVFDRFGRLPIELAVEYGTREDVEILFPFTSPVSTVANWSVDGIISHVKMEIKQLEDDNFVKKRMSELKLQADEAFKKQNYVNASALYTQALKMDNFDAKLLSNRSLCWLRMGDGQRAYDDASECKIICPKWAKAHYRQGAALMFMKAYGGAYEALSRALELDPENKDIEKLFWEALELK